MIDKRSVEWYHATTKFNVRKTKIYDNIKEVTPEMLSMTLSLLPEWRRESVMRYKHHSSRCESAMAFRLLQEMLREEFGLCDEISFSFGEHGKPYISSPHGVFFNISHCRNAVACVVATEEVGIDIETTGRYSKRLAEYTLSAAELSMLHAAEYPGMTHEEASDLFFTILWTKKEALLKLLGTGITDSLRNILATYSAKVDFNTTINIANRYVCTTAWWKD